MSIAATTITCLEESVGMLARMVIMQTQVSGVLWGVGCCGVGCFGVGGVGCGAGCCGVAQPAGLYSEGRGPRHSGYPRCLYVSIHLAVILLGAGRSLPRPLQVQAAASSGSGSGSGSGGGGRRDRSPSNASEYREHHREHAHGGLAKCHSIYDDSSRCVECPCVACVHVGEPGLAVPVSHSPPPPAHHQAREGGYCCAVPPLGASHTHLPPPPAPTEPLPAGASVSAPDPSPGLPCASPPPPPGAATAAAARQACTG